MVQRQYITRSSPDPHSPATAKVTKKAAATKKTSVASAKKATPKKTAAARSVSRSASPQKVPTKAAAAASKKSTVIMLQRDAGTAMGKFHHSFFHFQLHHAGHVVADVMAPMVHPSDEHWCGGGGPELTATLYVAGNQGKKWTYFTG